MRTSIWRWAAALGLAVATSETNSFAQYNTVYPLTGETFATAPQPLQPAPVVPVGFETLDEKVPPANKKKVIPELRRTPAPQPMKTPPPPPPAKADSALTPYPQTTPAPDFGFRCDPYGKPGEATCSHGVAGDCSSGGTSLSSCSSALASESCPRFNLQLFSGYESFRGIADGAFTGNNGGVTGFNAAAPLPGLEALGIGGQFGFSGATYDLMGRPTFETAKVQQQYFITAGFFRRADECCRLSFGLAYDWSVNDNFGAFSDEPFVSQWRAQVGYALNPVNEVGIWGTWIDRTDTAAGVRTYRPVSQVNLFWHHKYTCLNADTWLWLGQPNNGARGGNGTWGEFLVGTANQVAMSDRLALYINAAYLKPSANQGAAGSTEDGYQLGAGLIFFPTCGARTCSVAGRKWMPFMPVANNGTFWVDQF